MLTGQNYSTKLEFATHNIVEVHQGKLLNNFRSKRTPSHPDGYQPFPFGVYDIKTKTLETRRIDSGKSFITGKDYVSRVLTKQNARILRIPSRDSEQFHLLEKLRCRTWRQEQLRRLVSADSSHFARLNIAAELLQESVLRLRPQL